MENSQPLNDENSQNLSNSPNYQSNPNMGNFPMFPFPSFFHPHMANLGNFPFPCFHQISNHKKLILTCLVGLQQPLVMGKASINNPKHQLGPY